MTNQTPQNSRPPKDERQDELIAVLVALGAIGTILFWGFNRIGNSAKFASQLEGAPIAAEVDGDQDSLLALGDGDSDEGGLLGGLGLGGGDADGDRSMADADASADASADANTGQSNNSDLAAVGLGTAVGGSVLINPGRSDTDSTDTAAAGAGTDGAASEEAATPDDQTETNEVDSTADGEQSASADPEANAVEATDGDAVADDGSADAVDDVEPPELAVDVPAEEFSDIDKDYWASPFIEGLRTKNVATGFVDGTFEPDAPVSRSQFAAQIYRAFAQDQDTRALDYSDLPSSHPQYDAIGQVTTSGFMSGYPEGDFRPNDKVSKLEVLVALASGLNLDVPSDPESFVGNYYGDVSQIPDWAFPKIAAATKAGLVVNYDDLQSLDPSRPATRAEASAMLYQALVNLGEAPEVESDYVVKP